jgi:hypothetical protein
MSTPTPSIRSVLFLDLDDVICLNDTYGGYDVIAALGQVQRREKTLDDFPEIWAEVFNQQAKGHLKALHDEFNPIYCMSTSWARQMNRGAIVATLRKTGLGFVADNLHETWETVKVHSEVRAHEIRNWLNKHPEFDANWIALDDVGSGTGLAQWPHAKDRCCIVLCEVKVGLTDTEYLALRAAFQYRRDTTKKASRS